MKRSKVLVAGCLLVAAAAVAAVWLFGGGGWPTGRPASTDGTSSQKTASTDGISSPKTASSGAASSPETAPTASPADEMRGMWVTYFELGALFDAPEGFQAGFRALLDRCEGAGINALFVHVRSHCDAYYPSALFPWSRYVSGMKGEQGKDPGFDPLAFMIGETHARGMAFHAWVNPYRVLYDSTDLSDLCDSNPAKRWLTDGDPDNDSWVCEAQGGLYLNPAVEQVQALVVSGVREIVDAYEVDGVHFDDYFYPTTEETFDEKEYAAYRASVWDDPLPLADWRRAHVNAMVSRVYGAVKASRPACRFGISPMAGIRNNYETVFADVAAWAKGGYVDYLMPQLYFGFEYPKEESRFDRLLADWKAVAGSSGPALYIGLGAYRIGATDANNLEWSQHHDLLARQVRCLRESACGGFCLYSYSTYFADREDCAQEREALARELGR